MSEIDVEGCLACDLARGRRDLPGGRIYETGHWVVEHCVGPFGVGALIVKPLRHCERVWDLTDGEVSELGPLLRRATDAVASLLAPDQVFVTLWSFADWKPGHIHFVLQPAWSEMRRRFEHPGPCLQRDMLHEGELPPPDEVEAFAERARRAFHQG